MIANDESLKQIIQTTHHDLHGPKCIKIKIITVWATIAYVSKSELTKSL